MELVYSVDYRASAQTKDWVSDLKSCCSISCRNVVAVSRASCSDHERTSSQFDVHYEVHVLDLDKPWEPHKVTTSSHAIQKLEWDHTGMRLLLADVEGICQVWQMKNYLLNQWECIGTASVGGEEVLAMLWLHPGVQVSFVPDKKDSILYSEKFTRSRFSPSIVHFGGKHLDGWVVVTATGLVSVGIIRQQEPQLITARESLTPSHMRLSLADIAHTGNGDIMIATNDGLLSSAIQCFTVSLRLQQETVSISCQASASLYMKSQMEYGNSDSQHMQVTHVQFMNHENSDTLLVCCGSHTYSCIEIWQLVEQTRPLHKTFQVSSSPESTYKTPKWMHQAMVSHVSLLTGITGPQLPLNRNAVETAGFIPYMAATYKDGMLKIIHRYNFQVILSFNVDSVCLQTSGSIFEQKQRSLVYLAALQQTWSGCGLIGLHAGHIYLFRVYNMREGPMQMSHLILLLEYAMFVGYDWWDILLAIKQGMIESVCQRLTDNFQKQPTPMQELLYMRLLSLKMALYSSSSAGRQKAIDCHAKLVLHAISTVIRGVLRPKAVSAQDKSPAEKLSQLCSKNTDSDLDSLLVQLETEEFVIDSRRRDKATDMEGSLQSLQPLIQWVSDLALHLLACIPMYQSYSSFPGSSLLNDCSVLNSLRELLVIIRIWGIINSSCLPWFTTTSYVDCLSHLYKLLTKAWLCCKDGGSIEYEETLIDECCVLPSKVLIPALSQSFRVEDKSFAIFTQQQPQALVFGEEPEYLHSRRQSKYVYLTDIPLESKQKHDIIRQIHLGAKPTEAVRKCCRCGCMSLLQNLAKCQCLKAWEQRWAKHCLCGGHWKMEKC